jgi:hypothetical protein
MSIIGLDLQYKPEWKIQHEIIHVIVYFIL